MPIVILNKELTPKAPNREVKTSTISAKFPTTMVEVKNKWELVPNKNSKLVVSSTDEPLIFSGQSDNHLLNAIIYAYNTHGILRLSPDDLLQCFSATIVQCVNDNSEKYRGVFVNHQGKKKLVVESDSLDFTNLLSLLSDKIDENVETSLGLESTFTTSTTITRSTATLMKMATFKAYFEYGLVLGCGIRACDLTGTFADWVSLRAKVSRCLALFMSKGDLENWGSHFLFILNKLIDTYSGTVDDQFWSRVITYVPYGSGGQKYISGWAKVLFPGDSYNKYPKTLNLLDSTSKEPVRGGDCYAYQDRLKEWAQLCGNVSDGTTQVEAELNDNGTVFDLHCTVGFIGWKVVNNIAQAELGNYNVAQAELGYFVHSIPKDKAVITAVEDVDEPMDIPRVPRDKATIMALANVDEPMSLGEDIFALDKRLSSIPKSDDSFFSRVKQFFTRLFSK